VKRFLKQATAIALLAVSIFAVPSGNTAIAAKSNCTSVNKTYPFGIALNKQSIGTSRAIANRNKYIQLKYLDKDLDGIVCETEKLQTKVTTPVTTTVTATTTWLGLQCGTVIACNLGDRGPGGGKVFYDAGSEQPWGRYLEAAPDVLPPRSNWNDAMNAADAYRGGGLSGWRLPTKDELNIFFINRKEVGFYTTYVYWSSSEAGDGKAWYQMFYTGYQGAHLKDFKFDVRPVRAF
jgi:hypothetical protein